LPRSGAAQMAMAAMASNVPDDVPKRPRLTPIWTLKASQLLGAAAFACIAKYMPVFYAGIGIDRNMIGVLSFASMGMTFIGQIFWSAVIDWMGEYKTVLVGTQVAGTATLFFFTLDAVKSNIWLVFATAMTNTFLCSTGGSIIDAMCMRVLKEYKIAVNPTSTPRTVAGAQVSYGDTRLYSAVGWGGMSMIMGQLMDTFGLDAMFAGFAAIQALNVFIVTWFMPSPKKDEDQEAPADQPVTEEVGMWKILCSFSTLWFFANLFLYGVSMCLIENFLFVYIMQEFTNATTFLCGASTTIMCIFEIPVFKYVGPYLERQPAGSQKAITFVLVVCQIITAVRCWLYAIMPKDMAWLVLIVGSLQGVSFAAMWVASMEYAKRLSNDKTLAKMTSLTNGIYYSVSMGIGSLMWGAIVEQPPTGLGFRSSFTLDATCMVCWSIIWQLGLCCLSRTGGVRAEDINEGLASSS